MGTQKWLKIKNIICAYRGFLCPGIFSIIEGTEVTVDKVEKYVWGELLKV
jgi:hypothetical protein